MADTSPPAFPVPPPRLIDQHSYPDPGMTLRDYFAAQALMCVVGIHDIVPARFTEKDIAAMAYAIADAMLAERSKK